MTRNSETILIAIIIGIIIIIAVLLSIYPVQRGFSVVPAYNTAYSYGAYPATTSSNWVSSPSSYQTASSYYYPTTSSSTINTTTSVIPTTTTTYTTTGNTVTISGTLACLPHINSNGPQTMECAYGLRDNQGQYYALSNVNLFNIPTNSRIKVNGTLVSSQGGVYATVGTIQVNTVTVN